MMSCNDSANQSETDSRFQYKTYMSHNKAYEVEIPTGFVESSSIGDFMAFSNDETTYITIKSLPQGQTLSSFANSCHDNNNFIYSVTEQTDSLLCFSIRKQSQTIFRAHELYRMKVLNDVNYVISVASAKLSENDLGKMINHITNSLTPRSQSMEIVKDDEKSVNWGNDYSVRETKYYSIMYPSSWQMVKNPDQMTDVYLGDSDGRIGCTILFFDTDYSLAEINEESNISAQQAGMRLIENKQLTINGNRCYKAVYEFFYANTDIKQISYTFKRGNTMYNVKFGNNKRYVDEDIDIINNVINSFLIK